MVQRQQLDEPMPRSVWKDIILDWFVNFEKLFAAMEPGYDYQDMPKDFFGELALVKKEHAGAKKAVVSESDWGRVFGVWAAGVESIYPHRKGELQNYRKIIVEVFRTVLFHPGAAICFNADVRAWYVKEPFHMDDRSCLQVPMVAQLVNVSSFSTKRPLTASGTSYPSAKRANDPCINWNWARCETPCAFWRKHGKCSECGGRHQAKDVTARFASLQASEGKGRGDGSNEGGGRVTRS